MQFLKNYTVVVSVLFVAVGAGLWLFSQPASVTIDAKHWRCTDTEPVGIAAQCTNYAMKDSVRSTPLAMRQ